MKTWFIRCTIATHGDHDGEVHIHRRLWSRRLCQILYIVDGVTYDVPYEVFLEAMAKQSPRIMIQRGERI